MDLQTKAQPDNFSYGDPMDAVERRRTWPDTPPQVMLWRVERAGREEFALLASVSYDDKDHGRVITVPNMFNEFTTDLTSVPAIFTWLVPKSGRHLPAALIHDGLVLDKGGPVTYRTDPPGLAVDRIDADEVFRNAMRDTHVGLVRRWLVWSAVTTASLVVGPRAVWPLHKRLYYWAVVALLLGGIAYLGTCATFDLMDRHVPLVWDLPWMQEGSSWQEAVGGLAGAVVIPSALAVTWLRYWRAGLVGGIALAALFHVTVGIVALALGYQALEWLVRRAPWVAVALGAAGWVGALVLFVTWVR